MSYTNDNVETNNHVYSSYLYYIIIVWFPCMIACRFRLKLGHYEITNLSIVGISIALYPSLPTRSKHGAGCGCTGKICSFPHLRGSNCTSQEHLRYSMASVEDFRRFLMFIFNHTQGVLSPLRDSLLSLILIPFSTLLLDPVNFARLAQGARIYCCSYVRVIFPDHINATSKT